MTAPRNISREWDEIHAERDALRAELAQERNKRDATADMLRQARADAAFENRHRQLAAEAAEEFRIECDALRAENERLERKMKAHRETAVAAITGAEKQVDALRAENERLRTLIASDKEWVVGLYRKLAERDAEIEQLRVAMKEADAENGGLGAELEGLMAESKSSTEAMDRAREKIDALRAEVEELRAIKAGVVRVELANRLFGSDKYVPEQALDALRAEVERLTLADKQWADHVKRLADEGDVLNILLRNNQQRREEVEARHGDLLREVERLNQALDMVAEEREAWKAKALELRAAVENLLHSETRASQS